MQQYRKYFTSAQLQQLLESTPSWGVEVMTVGHHVHQSRKPYPDPNHPAKYQFDGQHGRVLDEFQLVYIANGQGIFESAAVVPTLVTGGTAFLLYPQVRHRYRPLEDTGWEEFWVGFKGQYAEYLMRQDCFDSQNPLLRIGFHAELLSVFTQLVHTLKQENLAYQQIATSQVIQLLGLVFASALMKKLHRSREEQVVHQAGYEMQQYWDTPMNFEELAQRFNVSYAWFRKAFKAVMGVPPGQYHLNLKLSKASQLLRETALPISEIAFACGFESMFYFSRIFKKKLRITPSEYRNSSL